MGFGEEVLAFQDPARGSQVILSRIAGRIAKEEIHNLFRGEVERGIGEAETGIGAILAGVGETRKNPQFATLDHISRAEHKVALNGNPRQICQWIARFLHSA